LQRRPDDRSSRAACCPALLNAERITVDGTDLLRFAEQAIEFQLEHVDASVAAIYNRDQRLPERTKMMPRWRERGR
jgi:hypothetical protein